MTASGPPADTFAARLEEIAAVTGSPDPDATRDAAPVGEVSGAARHTIPGYEILGELGRGGMGVVHRARDVRLNREVALKMILRADTSRVAVARFWAEAEVMAAVKNPHVVQVFELGEHDGSPFMAMELVPGGSLADRLKAAGSLPPHEAAELLEKIARGGAAAHELGIVHRDLKPGNVLLATDGTPKVTDFGLAKRTANDLTATQAFMGTPAYMAPEQAAGRAKFVGPQADVWALGVILYECLAGKRPFDGDSEATLLSQIQSAEPAALRKLVRALPRDLETIASKCLAKEAEHRYPTATELADDLGRFVRGEPIAARPVGRAERLVRWVRRKPTAAAAYGVSTLAVALGLGLFVILGFWREAERARRQAESARDEAAGLRDIANAGREKLAVIEYGRTVQAAHLEWQADNIRGAVALLNSTRPDLRGWEWRYVLRRCDSSLLTLKGHTDGVTSASFSGDRSRIVTGSGDGTAKVWDARSGTELLTLKGHTEVVVSASFSGDGSRIVTGSGDGTVKVWDTRPFDRDELPVAPMPREK